MRLLPKGTSGCMCVAMGAKTHGKPDKEPAKSTAEEDSDDETRRTTKCADNVMRWLVHKALFACHS